MTSGGGRRPCRRVLPGARAPVVASRLGAPGCGSADAHAPGTRFEARTGGDEMQGAPVDQQEFRAGQRRDWDEASKGWREWSDFIDRWTAPVSQHLMTMAHVGAGQRVLDVAAGY